MPYGWMGNMNNMPTGGPKNESEFLDEYGGAAGAGLVGFGLLDHFFGRQEYSAEDFNVDPSGLALREFNRRVDRNSDYNRDLRRTFQEIAVDSAPTTDTFLGVNRAAGVTGTGATALALRQGREQSNTALKLGTQGYERAYLASQDQAASFLGQYFQNQRGNQEMALKYQQLEDEGNFGDQLLSLGGGILSLLT